MRDMTALSEERFDVCYLLASYHHLETIAERESVLGALHGLLREDGGYVCLVNWHLLGERNYPKYQARETSPGDFRIKIGRYDRYYHGFTLAEIEGLARDAGYEILENRISEGDRNLVSILRWR